MKNRRFKNKKIAIRVDANKQIGLGHVMRTLSIAKALKKLGWESLFIIADESLKPLIKKNGFKIQCLNSDWQKMESELPQLINLIIKNKITMLLIDSYQITDYYLIEISKHTTVILIDDLGERCYPVQGIVNYNITSDLIDYQTLYKNKDTELFLGCQYVPLREEFQRIETPPIRRNVENILVTTGGSDSMLISEEIAEMVSGNPKFNNINFHFVCGMFYTNIKKLKEYENRYTNLFVYEEIQKISELMIKCDIAISGGGSTLYELCACGIPTLSFSFADNQDVGVKIFADKKCILSVGRWQKNSIKEIKKQLIILIKNEHLRCLLQENMSKIVNKDGAKKIASSFIKKALKKELLRQKHLSEKESHF